MIGRTVSHYKIVRKLGGGGMGVVYEAEDTKLKRTVALKFLPPDLTRDPDAKERFTREAQAASSLDHPNICTIHEIDETPEGQMFIGMAYYDGETLKKKISKDPHPVSEAIRIARDVALGLTKAHDAGMVHRDIKPANLMITSDGHVKIVDFGIAKLLGQANVTKTGTTLGTVSYMSPEQAGGADVDARADIFSLGVVLYELLTGRVPFTGEREAAVLYRIIHEEAEPIAAHRPDVPPELVRIVEKTLKKDVNQRYQSALELSTDLDALSQELALDQSGQRPAVAPASGGWRRWGLGLAGAVIIIGVITGILFQQRGGPPAAAELAIAVIDFQNLENPDDVALSAGMTGLIHVGLVESSPCRVVSPVYLRDLRRRLFGNARGPIASDQALEVARESGATMLLTGEMASLDGGQYVTWQLVSTADGKSVAAKKVDGKEMSVLVDGIITEVLPLLAKECEVEIPAQPPSVSAMTTDFPEAYDHYVAGMLAREDNRNQDMVRELKEAVEIDSTFALAHFELGRAYRTWFSELTLARKYTDQAWRHRGHLGIKDRMRLEVWRQQQDGNVRDAIDTYREMRGRWPDDRNILSDLGVVLTWWWYNVEAADVAAQATRLYPDDADFASSYKFSLSYAGRSQKALEVARASVERDPASESSWDDLGAIYLHLGLPDSAKVAFDKGLEIDPKYVWSQLGLSDCRNRKGDVDGAIEILEDILQRDDLLPARRISIHIYHGASSLVLLHMQRGRFQKALDTVEEARQYASGVEVLHELDKARSRVWLEMGRVEDVRRWAQDLSTRTDLPSAQMDALFYLPPVWVELDSLDRARSGAEDLLAFEGKRGAGVRNAYRTLARVALKEGDPDAALTALEELHRHGMPKDGYYEIEYLILRARAQRMAGRFDESTATLKNLLRIYGGYALGHYDLAQVYEDMGRHNDARSAYTAFLDAWSDADEGLPQVADARQRLDALTVAQ